MADRARLHATQFFEDFHRKHWIFFGHHPARKQKDSRIIGETQLAAKAAAIGGSIRKWSGIHSVIVHGIALWAAGTSGEKCVEGVIGDSDDSIGHSKTCLAHRFAKHLLL